jgi:hypothetical protein
MMAFPRAVSLSYASVDAQAAMRICAALWAGGIEVWFDQSELRGGDAWDMEIRRRIKSRVVFIPIVSRNSRDRVEGYAHNYVAHHAGRGQGPIRIAVGATPARIAGCPHRGVCCIWPR